VAAAAAAAAAQRAKLQEEGSNLERERDALRNEANDLELRERDAEGELLELQAEREQLEVRIAAAQHELHKADLRASESVTRRQAEEARLVSERGALREELGHIRDRSAQLEDGTMRIRRRANDARNAAQRAADEKAQLTGEVRERQGERAVLAADQADAARKAAEYRAQAATLQAEIAQLAQALEQEDCQLTREQQRLRAAEVRAGIDAEGEKRQLELTAQVLPAQLERERTETRHCEAVAEDWQKAIKESRDICGRLREQSSKLVEEVDWHQRQLRAFELARDAAREARVAMEDEAKKAEAEVKHLHATISLLEVQGVPTQRPVGSHLSPSRDHNHLEVVCGDRVRPLPVAAEFFGPYPASEPDASAR